MRLSDHPSRRRLSRSLTAALLLTVGCYPSIAPPGLTDGAWSGNDGDRQLVFEFTGSHIGVHASIHILRDGRKVTEKRAEMVEFEPPGLVVRWQGKRHFIGSVDLGRRRIDGDLSGVPGGARELFLEQVDPSDVPGLLARPPAAAGEAYTWTRPGKGRDGWLTATPEEVGIARVALERTVAEVLAGEAGQIHSLLIARDGNLVLEEYFHGWKADDLHRIASCTESIASLLVGIAIARGEIEGVDAPLLDFFPEHAADAGAGWEAMRLEHLLTMSMGLDWTHREANAFPLAGRDRFVEVIRRNVATEPGSRWRYVSRNTNLLSGVIVSATGSHADEFAAKYLFGPLGITLWDWEKDKYEGHPEMTGTLKLRPRDMAKLGQLVLDEGTWRGQRIVPADWIRESTRPHFHPVPDDDYGYLWWGLDEPEPGGIDMAAGIGSQYIVVVPAFEVVMVVTGGNEFNDMQSALFAVTRRSLLPGMS